MWIRGKVRDRLVFEGHGLGRVLANYAPSFWRLFDLYAEFQDEARFFRRVAPCCRDRQPKRPIDATSPYPLTIDNRPSR
jgi:hypothetical protein